MVVVKTGWKGRPGQGGNGLDVAAQPARSEEYMYYLP
jgi:hypothetical protein